MLLVAERGRLLGEEPSAEVGDRGEAGEEVVPSGYLALDVLHGVGGFIVFFIVVERYAHLAGILSFSIPFLPYLSQSLLLHPSHPLNPFCEKLVQNDRRAVGGDDGGRAKVRLELPEVGGAGQDEVQGGRAFGALGVGEMDGGGNLRGQGGDAFLFLCMARFSDITTEVAQEIVAKWHLQTPEAVVIHIEQTWLARRLCLRLERTGPSTMVGLLLEARRQLSEQDGADAGVIVRLGGCSSAGSGFVVREGKLGLHCRQVEQRCVVVGRGR